MKTRVIPILLLEERGLVKTKHFRNPRYIGDPVNTVKIFNEKEVDEILIFDIRENFPENIDYEMLRAIAGEAFMPLSYGGRISTLTQAEKVLQLGFEKIFINSVSYSNLELIRLLVSTFGSQSVGCCIDIKKNLLFGYSLYSNGSRRKQSINLKQHLDHIMAAGVGEIVIQSMDRDGTQKGFDIDLIKFVSENTTVPIVACGGAGSLDDLVKAVKLGGASAVAAGSLFSFFGAHNAVLINYPQREKLEELLP